MAFMCVYRQQQCNVKDTTIHKHTHDFFFLEPLSPLSTHIAYGRHYITDNFTYQSSIRRVIMIHSNVLLKKKSRNMQ